jgi:hypothetical protein
MMLWTAPHPASEASERRAAGASGRKDNQQRGEQCARAAGGKGADKVRANPFWLSDEPWRQIEPHLPTDVRGIEVDL